MTDDEKRPPEGVPPKKEGAAPASANAIGTATAQNKVPTSNNVTSLTNWRGVNQDLILSRALDGCWLGSFGAMQPMREDLDAVRLGRCSNGDPLPKPSNRWQDVAAVPQDIWLAPDQAWSAIADNVVAMVDVTRVERREVAALFDFACHGFATGPRLYVYEVEDEKTGKTHT